MALLGVTVDETETASQPLAMQALRALLDASAEVGRRDQGLFHEASPVFRSVMGRINNQGSSFCTTVADNNGSMSTLDWMLPEIATPLQVEEHHAGPASLPMHGLPPIPAIAAARPR